MKPPILVFVSFGIALATASANASTTPEPHHLQPNAPRSVTVTEAETPPVIRAGRLQSTLILLPAEEKIATVFGGDTVDWVFDGGHVASRFISVKPKLANTTTDILAPVIGVRRKKDSEAEKDIRTQNQGVLIGFRSAYVFDVSQTDGADLPELSERVKGNVGDYRERLLDFIATQGIRLEFKESIAPALGMSYGGRIAILPGQGAAEEFSTLVHELAHEMLHKVERRTATTKTVRETEAEAIAFVVGTTIGLSTGRASADYIHLYHGNAALLTESLEVIQRTSAVILSALESAASASSHESSLAEAS